MQHAGRYIISRCWHNVAQFSEFTSIGLTKKNPNYKRKSDEIETPTNSDISGEVDDNTTGEGADVVPSLRQMVVLHVKKGGRAGAAKEPSSSFFVSGGRGAAVLRWLRLITLHHFAIWSLLSTSTVKKLPQLSLNLVQTTLPCEDQAMQPLEPYFNGMEKPPNSDDIRLFVEAMERQEKDVDVFKGTYHCEAILLSLYLLHYETRDKKAASFDLPEFWKSVGVADDLAKAAGDFFPGVVNYFMLCTNYWARRTTPSAVMRRTPLVLCRLFFPRSTRRWWRMHLKSDWSRRWRTT
jgi:hypothetical protein